MSGDAGLGIDSEAASPAPVARAPGAGNREKLDPTVPLTAFLVLAILVGGVVAARTHSPAPLDLAAAGAVLPASPAAPVTEPVDEAAVAGCRPVVEALTVPSSGRTVDLADLMQKGAFPVPPLAGFDTAAVTGPSRSGSVAEYLARTQVVDPALWERTMSRDGFRGAAAVTFRKGGETYGAEALRFEGGGEALEFNRLTLSAVCASGRMAGARPIPDVPGGIAYVSAGPGPLTHRASVVVGDSVAHMSLCDCLQGGDLQALVGAWARAVVAHVDAV